MEFFTFISKDSVHLPPGKKVISSEGFSTLLQAIDILIQAQNEALDFREEVAKECEHLREKAELAGFEKGLFLLNEQIAHMEQEIVKVRKDMENIIVPLAMTAAKKIVGREIELKPDTVVDIVLNALKAVAQHKRIVIYVNKLDYDVLEKNRPRLKQLFEHSEILSLQIRDDVTPMGCIIETEAGIINAQSETQWRALENAFNTLMKTLLKEHS